MSRRHGTVVPNLSQVCVPTRAARTAAAPRVSGCSAGSQSGPDCRSGLLSRQLRLLCPVAAGLQPLRTCGESIRGQNCVAPPGPFTEKADAHPYSVVFADRHFSRRTTAGGTSFMQCATKKSSPAWSRVLKKSACNLRCATFLVATLLVHSSENPSRRPDSRGLR
jgi:hypothetical protein